MNKFLSTELKDVLNRCAFNEVHVVQTMATGVQVYRLFTIEGVVEV